MVLELVEFKRRLPIYAPCPKSVGREGGCQWQRAFRAKVGNDPPHKKSVKLLKYL